jgi:oligopeptide/dipeptide ABC transporter ATP-binding protein
MTASWMGGNTLASTPAGDDHGESGSAAGLPVLLEGVDVGYPSRRRGRRAQDAPVVHDVSLSIGEGQTLGLVGESGSGKTTLGRALLGFLPARSGRIRVGGFDVTSFGGRVPLAYRRSVQVVFQDPVASLTPMKTVADLVGEPLEVHVGLRGVERDRRVGELLEQVGLSASHLGRLPHEFSGGQRQRIAIARALAVDPGVLVLDEPVSALDVSTQAQVVHLLEDLQRSRGMTYLFIAHDLALVRHASHRIAVMYRGRIVEEGPADQVCEQPAHPYTALLMASAPEPDPMLQASRRELRQSITATTTTQPTTGGCVFAPRCPVALDRCWQQHPEPVPLPLPQGGWAACHRALDEEARVIATSDKPPPVVDRDPDRTMQDGETR